MASNTGRAVIDFGDAGASDASVDVIQQTGIKPGAIVRAWMDRRATDDHSEDEHTVERFHVTAGNIVEGVGFTVYAVLTDQTIDAAGAAPMTTGQWAVAWEWSL